MIGIVHVCEMMADDIPKYFVFIFCQLSVGFVGITSLCEESCSIGPRLKYVNHTLY